jgi:hypothetical protein
MTRSPSALALGLCLAACSKQPAAPSGDQKAPAPTVAPIASPPSAADVEAAPVDAGAILPLAEVKLPDGATPCHEGRAEPACYRFASARDAFVWVAAHDPKVLAIGEAHAQKGTEGIVSSTKRFTDDLLPVIAPRATDLLLELWLGDPRCKREVAAVASAQKPVVQKQAKSNPNEFIQLGDRAKALGVQPHVLRPTCDDYAELADAGADAVPKMLSLIRRLSTVDARSYLDRNAQKAPAKMVVLYGGALHNDASPPEASRDWSFGPDLIRETGGRYVELDLIVPEFVKKTPVWEKLPWYAAWAADTAAPKDKATLYRTGDRSFALIFPRTK